MDRITTPFGFRSTADEVLHGVNLDERFCSASHFIIRSCLLSVPYRQALPNMGRAFQFVDHRDGVILN